MDQHTFTLSSSRDRSETVIRSSALGELVSMLLAALGLMGAIAWAAYICESPIVLILIVSGVWLGMRSAGVGLRSRLSPVLTLSLLSGAVAVATSYLGKCPDWLTHGPAAPGVFLILLCIQFVIDLGDLWKQHSPEWSWWTTENWNWSRIALWSLFFLAGTYLVFIPAASALWESINPPKKFNTLDDLTFADQIRIRTTSFIVAGWFFTLGATIGSYLNVVVYRVPRRESLVRKPSSCPQCHSRIETRDNIPILGWLMLNGRCRQCQASISARYPVVEFLTGSLFLLLYHLELISGGANLPVRESNSYTGVIWIILYTKWDLIGYYLFHCFLLCVLWTWFLIVYDRNTVPVRTAISMLILALLAVLIWPGLQLVPAWHVTESPWTPSRIEGMITAFAGMLTGTILGGIILWRFRQLDQKSLVVSIAAFAITGMILGWQSILAISLSQVIFLLMWITFGMQFRVSLAAVMIGGVLINSLGHLLLWRTLAIHLQRWWPGPMTTLSDVFLWMSIFACLLVLAGTIRVRMKPVSITVSRWD